MRWLGRMISRSNSAKVEKAFGSDIVLQTSKGALHVDVARKRGPAGEAWVGRRFFEKEGSDQRERKEITTAVVSRSVGEASFEDQKARRMTCSTWAASGDDQTLRKRVRRTDVVDPFELAPTCNDMWAL